MKRIAIISGVSLLSVLLLSACVSVGAPETDTELPATGGELADPESDTEVDKQGTAQQEPAATLEPVEVPVDTEMSGEDSEPEGEEAASESPPPVLKTELEATAPSTVSLASGNVQLIEFFAYW